ncbi:MAG: flagellar basal-body MS-ring/collar protein FliF [Legionellales bacterium]
MIDLQQALPWFNALAMKRKVTLLLSLMLILVATIWVSWWALTPSYAVLFNHLDEQDANKILSRLEQEHINYQLQNGGSEILIDNSLIAKTRLKMMDGGMQLAASVGFELFDKSDFGMTDFSQKINYQRALQGELERTIASLDEISQARVHLMIPENHLFEKEDNHPKAAVTLHLKRTLTAKQVRSIQQLIMASTAHLTQNDVVVVDQNGNTLSAADDDGLTTHLSTKKSVEHYLNDKVMQMLHKIFAEDQVMVKIDASLNYDEIQRELTKPQAHGQITHEKESKHTSTNKSEKNKQNQDITLEKSYQFGSEKELFKRANGTIDQLSISVVLPQQTKEQTIDKVRRLVKNTVGFNEKRGDTISVEALINPVALVLQSKVSHKMVPDNKAVADALSKDAILMLLVLFIIISTTSTVLIKRIRHKKRQLLLIELTTWLHHHEQ